MEFIHSTKAPAAIGPYSQAVRAGELIFISGQLPVVPVVNELINDPEKATATILKNAEAILNEVGLTLNHIVKVNIYLKKMKDFDIVNKAYAEIFGDHKPARACIEVSQLPKSAIMEMDFVAAID